MTPRRLHELRVAAQAVIHDRAASPPRRQSAMRLMATATTLAALRQRPQSPKIAAEAVRITELVEKYASAFEDATPRSE